MRRLAPCHTTGSVSRTANQQHQQSYAQQSYGKPHRKKKSFLSELFDD